MEDPDFTVLLTGTSPHDPTALKAVRTVTGLSLWRSRELLDSAPATVQSGIPFDIAARAAQHLRQAGVPAAIQCGWCQRTLPDGDTPVDPGPCASLYWPTAHCPANSMTSCDCGFCAVHGPLPGHTAHPGP
ncbi:ribosomal protein L7/L12 [Kitasatospora aureofaciens]|uniref:ribosomal protein L7/L12 n=1 Tax=Kitasatospora aureofaciens TaxID=1894 RepID=UPI001F4511DC|nr:ribosomal protein L7/L12 [Kitasatospora aureofaciens]